MRFPEFSGEWENKILKSVLKCHDNFRIPLSDKQRKNMKGQYAYYGANGIIDFIDKFIFNGNYILLAEDGGKFDEFRTKPIAHKASGKFWVNNHAHVLSTNNILDFVFYQLEHKDIRSFINIGSRSKLNKNDMFNIIISLCSLKEQSKIANFLSLIDKRIELQNKIIKDYELLKKLLMNKFLSNFNLREISIYSLVKSQLIRIIKASELKKFNGTKSYLSTSSIDENGSISPEKEISFFDRPSRASMIPYRNSVWFARMKDTNKVYISKNNDEEKYILSTGFYGILPIENDIDPIWLFEIFKSKYFIVQKDKLSEGGTMSGIKDSQLNELNIKIWLDKEMQNFACKLLKSFTKIIEIELGKENSLIKLKSYLLKTLFI